MENNYFQTKKREKNGGGEDKREGEKRERGGRGGRVMKIQLSKVTYKEIRGEG